MKWYLNKLYTLVYIYKPLQQKVAIGRSLRPRLLLIFRRHPKNDEEGGAPARPARGAIFPIFGIFAKSGGLPPPARKRRKMGEKCVFWAKKCEKMAIFGIFGQKVF